MNNAENSISEPVGFKIFWGSMPPPPLEVRKTCLVCYESLSDCGPVWQRYGLGGGGGGWQFFLIEFGKLQVPLKKSWLRSWLREPIRMLLFIRDQLSRIIKTIYKEKPRPCEDHPGFSKGVQEGETSLLSLVP